MLNWIKAQWARIWNLKFFDKWIKLIYRFVHYEYFYFVVIFITTGVALTYGIIIVLSPVVAAAACYYIGVSIKVVWAIFNALIIAEEKQNIAKESKTDVFCLMYGETINNLKDAKGFGKNEACDFLLDKFKTSFNGLITYGSENITEEMKDLYDKVNRLDSTDSKFIEDLSKIETDLKEIATKLSSNLKTEG